MVLLDYFHSNFLYVYTKTTLQMFHLGIHHKLSSPQIASSHCMFCLLCTLKMMVNVATTSQPTIAYSTLQHILLLSTPLLLLLFSINMLPLLIFIYAHSSALHFPLLLSTIFQLHSLHSCFYELEFQKCSQLLITNENNFQQFFCLFLSLSFPHVSFIFFRMATVF